MKIAILKEIFAKYPRTQIGYVVANIKVRKTSEYSDNLKKNLRNHVVKRMKLTDKTYDKHPHIVGWRKVFADFDVNPNYKASVDALLKRVVTGGKPWDISSVVDLYNVCSVMSVMPMGGYDLKKIKGDIVLRYGKEGETVAPLGTNDTFPVMPKHVIYADNDKVLCWLWNYRDSRLSCIDNETESAIFFIDSAFEQEPQSMQNGIEMFSNHLKNLGSQIVCTGVLDAKQPEQDLDLDKLLANRLVTVEKSLHSSGAVVLEKKNNVENKSEDSQNSFKVRKKEKAHLEANLSSAFVFKQILMPLEEEVKNIGLVEGFAATRSVSDLKVFYKSHPDIRFYKNFFDNNLVHVAVRNENIPNIEFLLDEVQVDINCKNKVGNTPLMLALEFKLKSVIPILLKRNPDLTCVNNEGETALTLARKYGFQEFLNVLDPMKKVAEQKTLGAVDLIDAAKAGNFLLVQQIVKAKADVNIVDSQKFTPYMHATKSGHLDIATYLLSVGAFRPHDPMGNVVVDEEFVAESIVGLKTKI